MAKGVDMKEQLAYLLSTYSTAQHLEPEIAACPLFKCKTPDKISKKERYFFALDIQPHLPLTSVYPLIKMALIYANATAADGLPPSGPLIRGAPRK